MNLKNIESLDELEVGGVVYTQGLRPLKILAKIDQIVGVEGNKTPVSWHDLTSLNQQNLQIEMPTWKPKDGERYFVPLVSSEYGIFVGDTTWSNSDLDLHRLEYGLAFETKEEAEARYHKILKLIKP